MDIEGPQDGLLEERLEVDRGGYPSIYGYPCSVRTALMFACLNSTDPFDRFRRNRRSRRLCSDLLTGTPASSSRSISK